MAPDPEAPGGEVEGEEGEVQREERALQRRLVQWGVTRVLEAWAGGLRDVGGVVGMGWAGRYGEVRGLERGVEGRKRLGERFEEEGELVARTETVEQILVSRSSLILAAGSMLMG